MNDIRDLKREFLQLYGGAEESIRTFHAPGRVNLIGEHVDYNGGSVFPAALTFGTTMLIRKRNDASVRLASTNLSLRKDIDVNQIAYDSDDDWTNYPKGMFLHLQQRGYSFGGYDVLYSGAIPNGAGLSSSASIEVVTGFGILSMEGHSVDTVQLALIAQEVENQFIGVNCGIMDQFAVANGKKDHALLLNCDTLEYELVPFQSGHYRIVIGNTNKRRGLVDSAYNERRAQCERAVQDLQAVFPGLKLLGELTLEQFEANAERINDPTVRNRARHVIEEIDRVAQSVHALKHGDLASFGRLMTASHASLRDLYEVTGPELDAMVDAALTVSGVLGSRMTGAGFGGCTVSLVHEDHVDAFIRQVGDRYLAEIGLRADFYVCDIGDGVQEREA